MKTAVTGKKAAESSFWGGPRHEIAAGLCLILSVCTAVGSFARSQAPADSLQVGRPVQSLLKNGQSDDYSLDLTEDQFLQFTVTPKTGGTKIQIAISDPAGNPIESQSGLSCSLPFYFLPAVSGVHHIRLMLLPAQKNLAPYTIEINELRRATKEDKNRVAAGQQLLEACGEEQQQPQSRKDATRKYEQAISLFSAINDARSEATVLDFLAYRAFLGSEFSAAVAYARNAQPLWESLDDIPKEALDFERIRVSSLRLDRFEEALSAADHAVTLWHSAGDALEEARARADRGDIHENLGEYQDAIDDKEQALSAFRSGVGRPEDEYSLLADLGRIEGDLNQPEKALVYFEQALEVAQSNGDHSAEPGLLVAVGEAYAVLGDKAKALTYHLRAVEAAKGDAGAEAWMRLNLAKFYRQNGETSKALDLYGEVLPYFQSEHRVMLEAGALQGTGAIYRKQNNLPRALEAFNQALSIWPPQSGFPAGILYNIGSVYREEGNHAKALECFRKILDESRASKNRELEAFTLVDIARVEHALRNDVDARRDIEEAIEILESVRAGLAAPESRASYFASVQSCYEFYIELLMQLNGQHPGSGFDAIAFQTSERARARSLLDLLAEAHADIHQGVDPRLLERERTLQQRLRRTSERQVEVLSRNHTAEQAQSIARELESVTAEYDDTEAQIRASSPGYAALTHPEPLTVEQVQRAILDPGTLLLQYSLGEKHSYVWAVTNSALAGFTLPERSEIEQTARKLYDLLTERNRHPKGEKETQRQARLAHASAEYPAAAARLSQMVLGPVSGFLSGKSRVVIVSDGALQYIPFAALPIPNGNKGPTEFCPLLLTAEVVNAPSASIIAAIRRDVAQRRPAPKAIAVLADPVFSRDDPRVRSTAQISQIRYTARKSVPEQHLPIDLERSWTDVAAGNAWKIPRLPFSRREANAILAAANPDSRFEAVDFRADRATATSPDLAQYRFLHFATHGILDSRTPGLSGIVLSLVDPRGRAQNGFLRLWDIYNLHLPADLVVLSACQTALGKEVKGEGLIGLTRGFFYAGAARVVASLWKVDDAATAELMAQLYEGMLKKGLSPASALRSAQLAMWRQSRWQGDPYFWAAFQLQGEWR